MAQIGEPPVLRVGFGVGGNLHPGFGLDFGFGAVVASRSRPWVVVLRRVGDHEHGGVHAASLDLLPCWATL